MVLFQLVSDSSSDFRFRCSFIIVTELGAFLFGGEVVGVAVTTAESERHAFAGSRVEEVPFNVRATWTDHHRLGADAVTALTRKEGE